MATKQSHVRGAFSASLRIVLVPEQLGRIGNLQSES